MHKEIHINEEASIKGLIFSVSNAWELREALPSPAWYTCGEGCYIEEKWEILLRKFRGFLIAHADAETADEMEGIKHYLGSVYDEVYDIVDKALEKHGFNL